MKQIPELKNMFQPGVSKIQGAAATFDAGEPHLLGYNQKPSTEEILGAIPSRAVVDVLVAESFDGTDNEASMLLNQRLCLKLN